MIIVNTIEDLKKALFLPHSQEESIGLVPTMGALHEGHASLVRRCVKENKICVVSIFVNPTQFNDKNDLNHYPRNLQADCELLSRLHADIVFAPSVEEVYPVPDTRTFSYPPTDSVMEGARRPGHFNGVCQIVSKLFSWIRPTRAYFGEKDFQQIAVIRAMVADLKIPVELRPCPIVREKSGLALSSRNTLLSPQERCIAASIHRVLSESLTFSKNHSISETHNFVVNALNAITELEVEYYEIVNGYSLASIHSWDEASYIVGCITVYCGSNRIRLIDNITYKV